MTDLRETLMVEITRMKEGGQIIMVVPETMQMTSTPDHLVEIPKDNSQPRDFSMLEHLDVHFVLKISGKIAVQSIRQTCEKSYRVS